MTKSFQGLFLAGTASNVGKTSAALGLIALLRKRGLVVHTAKAGPDFLDAAWLALASGHPCVNLDTFMAPEYAWRRVWEHFMANCDFALVEGAMGLYDGAETGEHSGGHLASALNLPILLLINAKGMAQSAAAVAQGFLHYHPPHLPSPPRFCGVICTHVASERHWQMLETSLKPVCEAAGVPLAGYLPTDGKPELESRHLGLKQACESALDLQAAGTWCSHVDLDAILTRCGTMQPLEAAESTYATDVTIAIARDEAFAFCYADLPLLLQELGADVVYFSPLNDKNLPDCDGIYIPGGYPELYAPQLAANTAMLKALRQAATERALPVYGECGGYMYLLEAVITLDGNKWPMTELLPGEARMSKKLTALGYRASTGQWLSDVIYGHEFHYAQGPPIAQPLLDFRNSRGLPTAAAIIKQGPVIGSWVHLYPQGSRPFWQKWLSMVRDRRHQYSE